MMLFEFLFVLLLVLFLAAIELASVFALAAAGIISAFCLLALGAPLPAIIQFFTTGAAVYLFYQKIMPKIVDRGWSVGAWLSSFVALVFIIITLFAAIPAGGQFTALAPFILLMVGIYAVAVKKDLARITVGIIVMEFSGELMLVSAGEKSGLTALVGLAAIMAFIFIAAGVDDLDVSKLKELKG